MSGALPEAPLRVGLVQVAAGEQVETNRTRVQEQVDRLPEVDLIALPEVFACRGPAGLLRQHAEALEGPSLAFLQTLARQRRAWVLGGSIAERDGERVYNTSLLVDRSGTLQGTYRKKHLFEVHQDDGHIIRESDVFTPGSRLVLANIEGWRCGLSICFDLRFPELYRHYAADGAHLVLVPSNFTRATGEAHWHTLLRARAIENQMFVAAPAQCGPIPGTGIDSFGHSLVVDPWGRVLADAGTEETVTCTELTPDLLREVRRRLPGVRPGITPGAGPSRQG